MQSIFGALLTAGYAAAVAATIASAPNGGRTSDFATEDAAREAISKLPPEQVLADLQSAAAYVRKLPSTNGKLAVAGFCWGGSRAWEAANTIDGLTATYVFYGTGPSSDEGVTGIEAPVYGFYGGADERVNATIEATRALMQKHGKTFDPVIYPGAGHAFMRAGEAPDATPANKAAHDQSWARWTPLLHALE